MRKIITTIIILIFNLHNIGMTRPCPTGLISHNLLRPMAFGKSMGAGEFDSRLSAPITTFEQMLERVRSAKDKTAVVVPAAETKSSLQAIDILIEKLGDKARAILIGDAQQIQEMVKGEAKDTEPLHNILASRTKILNIAEGQSLIDIAGAAVGSLTDNIVTVVNMPDDKDGARANELAVECVKTGKVKILLKGRTSSDELMPKVVDGLKDILKESGTIISHIRPVQTPKGLLLLADGGINVLSNIKDDAKRRDRMLCILRNTAEVARKLGKKRPRICLIVGDKEQKRQQLEDFKFLLHEVNQGGWDFECEITTFDEAFVFDGDRLVKQPDIIMFGNISAANILYKAVVMPAHKPEQGERLHFLEDLAWEGGIRVSVFEKIKEGQEKRRFLFIATPGPNADCEAKKALIDIAAAIARKRGVRRPKVALVDFTEKTEGPTVKDTPSIIDAKRLRGYYQSVKERAHVAGGEIDMLPDVAGPMDIYMAFSKSVADRKGAQSAVCGNADILVMPDYDSGIILTALYKSWYKLSLPWLASDISAGGPVSVLVPSRGDDGNHKWRSVLTARFLQMQEGPTAKSASAGTVDENIFWPRQPEAGYPQNPYGEENVIKRDLLRLDSVYDNDITKEIDTRLKAVAGKPLKILLIGVGRGYEAFGMMKKYGDNIEVTATALEDLMYRTPQELQDRFAEDGITITAEEAATYIDTLRNRHYIKCDLEEGILLGENKYDIIIFGNGVIEYPKNKAFALEEAIRVCKEGGVVYCSIVEAFVMVDFEKVKMADYLESLHSPNIIRIKDKAMKFVKTRGFVFPKFKGMITDVARDSFAIQYITYYILEDDASGLGGFAASPFVDAKIKTSIDRAA